MQTALAAAGVFLLAVSPIIVISAVVRAVAWLRSGRGRGHGGGRHRARPDRPANRPPGTDD